jgi:uncharacterized protein (UPF0261 family)
MPTTPSNDTATCVICGDPIQESHGEVACYIPLSDRDAYEYDGEAYHMNKCEGEIFAEIYAEVDDGCS